MKHLDRMFNFNWQKSSIGSNFTYWTFNLPTQNISNAFIDLWTYLLIFFQEFPKKIVLACSMGLEKHFAESAVMVLIRGLGYTLDNKWCLIWFWHFQLQLVIVIAAGAVGVPKKWLYNDDYCCKMHASERGGGVFLLRHVNSRRHSLTHL